MKLDTPENLLKACAAQVPGIVLDRSTGKLAAAQPGLSDRLTAKLHAMADAVLPLLAPPATADAQTSVELLAELDEQLEFVTDAERARSVVLSLCLDASRYACPIGIDMETVPLPAYRSPTQTVIITKAGERAARQTPPKDEAAALDPHRSRPRLVQLNAGGGITYVIDMDRVPADVLLPLCDHALVAANTKFEIKHWLFNLGLPSPLDWHDCLTGLWQTHGRQFSGSDRTLGTATKLVTGITLPKGLGASDWSGALSKEQIAYAALDALAAHDLYEITKTMLDEEERYVLALDDAVLEPIARAEYVGITLDVDAHQQLIDRWRATETELTAQIVTETGGIELNTPRAVAAYLEQTLAPDRLAAWPMTASGSSLSTAKAHISRAMDIPGIKPLIARTSVQKLLSNFAEATLANVNSVTGRVHTSFRCPGAKTGRLSSARPNLQQIPKRQSKDARKSFVAAPGKVLVALDYSQMELRAASELSGDAAMKGVYDRGEDLHSTTAMAIAGNTDKDSRTLAKAINFGLLFGAGSATFAAATWAGWGIDLPVADAERHRETFFRTYPKFRQYQLNVTRDAELRGYARTVCGRKWRWQWEPQVQNDYTGEWSGFRYTLALNLPIQGSCAEVVKLAIANVEPAVRKHHGGQLILQVHDELIIEVDDNPEVVRSVIRLARAKMSAAFLEVFPNSTCHGLVDAEVGLSWGSLTAVHTWLEARTMHLITNPKEIAHDT